jgi:hypothetical protein
MALNPAMDMAKPQGLAKNAAYTGKVVQNNDKEKHPDKRMLGRVQIRVDTIFEGVKDEMLPWAIPEFGSNCDGASATSGSFSVPKIGTKVLVYFQDGSPLHPKYSAYTVDEKTTLKEREHNYPDRTVHLFQNGCMLLVDTKSNEVFFRDPGTLQMYIVGDLNLSVDGNVVEKIQGNRTTYVKGNVVEKVDGNKELYLTGDYKETIKGKHDQNVTGAFTESIHGAKTLYAAAGSTDNITGSNKVLVAGDDTHSASGGMIRSGSRIDDNPGGSGGSAASGPSAPAAPTIPTMPKWTGVRGKKPDSTDDKPPE